MDTTTLLMVIAVTVGSYLIGSLNSAVILSKLVYGDDIRRHGSGNAGMTNMLRVYGKKAAIYTTIGDFSKVAAAILISRLIFHMMDLTLAVNIGSISGVAVFLGHAFPIFFGFAGGKGVVTTLGTILCVNPLVFLIIALIFIPMAFITRIVSLASVLGGTSYPIVTWLVLTLMGREPLYDTIAAAVFSLLIIIMHRENIKRLLNGTENRFGKPKDS